MASPVLQSIQPPVQWLPAVIFPEIKRSERVTDHSPASSAKILTAQCLDAVTSGLEPTQPPSSEYRGGWNMKLTAGLELLPRFRICGALMTLPYTHLRLRARDDFSIYISNSG
jgi:hypothetical protein